jgi:hypothetical protein
MQKKEVWANHVLLFGSSNATIDCLPQDFLDEHGLTWQLQSFHGLCADAAIGKLKRACESMCAFGNGEGDACVTPLGDEDKEPTVSRESQKQPELKSVDTVAIVLVLGANHIGWGGNREIVVMRMKILQKKLISWGFQPPLLIMPFKRHVDKDGSSTIKNRTTFDGVHYDSMEHAHIRESIIQYLL